MLITSLSKMEEIVESHPNLSWNGWDVVMYKKNDAAEFSANGCYKNGNWYNKYVYPIMEDGWSIPEKIAR